MSETTPESPKKKNWFARHKVLTVIGVLIIFAIIGSGGSKKTDTQTASKTESTPTTSPAVKGTETTSTPTPAAKTPSVPAEYASALTKATEYSNMMHMSKAGVSDQLTSDYGEKFTAAAAQYAIDNVKANWNANALAKAKDYQKRMSMSPAAIRDQLVSSNGEKFTAAEADYAIQHLND
jgi:hypothetical protein